MARGLRFKVLSTNQIRLQQGRAIKSSWEALLPIFCRTLSRICSRKFSRPICTAHRILTWYSGQIKNFVEGLFSLNSAYDRFKLNLRDFLIQLKEFAGDNAELFAEEKEQLERDAKAAERERLSKVGGLLKPAELAEDDDEL